MRPLLRFVAAAASLAALSSVVTSCDTSPYAASVNSQVIKKTALDAELGAWAGNKQYVSAVDSSSSSSGVTVVGDAPGTYNNGWVSSILTNIVMATVVHQRVVSTGRRIDGTAMEAARAVSEISQIGWDSFPASFRDTLVLRLAEDAAVTPLAVNSQTLGEVYSQYRQYFFTRVCVRQAAAFSSAQASRLSSEARIAGIAVCYGQADLESQPASLRNAVMTLAVGKVSAPLRTAYGYVVLQVSSRQSIPLSIELQRTISVAILNAQGLSNNAVNGLLIKAKVKVNPAFGTWSSGQVVPPRAPGQSA